MQRSKKKYFLAAAACVFAAASMASAQTAVFSFDDHNGAPDSGTYMPGDSFTFSIDLTFAPGGTVQNLEGLSYWFEQQNPSAPFFFAITLRDVTGSQFTDLQTPGLIYPQTLAPSNAKDLGAFLPGNTSALGTGTYFIANLTISIDPSALPGVYQIENTTTGGKTSVITDDQGHTFPISQAIYTITIVPEPSSLALCATGFALVAGVVRRRYSRLR
jgi:hypothetical protein